MEVESPQRQSLRLPADCSISGIRIAHDLIRQSMCHQRPLELDCSAVDRADVTSIQLLISAIRTADQQGRTLTLTALSKNLETTFLRAGISSHSGLDPSSFENSETK